MVFCAANKAGPHTRDVTLEMIGVNVSEGRLLGLYYQGAEPIGYVKLGFCDHATWKEYSPLKRKALDLAVNLGGVDGAVLRAHIVEVLLDQDMMRRLAVSHFAYNAVRLEIDDDLAGAFSSNEINRIAERVSDIGKYWGEDGDPEEFQSRVLSLVEKGLAWPPENIDGLRELIGGAA